MDCKSCSAEEKLFCFSVWKVLWHSDSEEGREGDCHHPLPWERNDVRKTNVTGVNVESMETTLMYHTQESQYLSIIAMVQNI